MKPIAIIVAIVLALIVAGSVYLLLMRAPEARSSEAEQGKAPGIVERYKEIANPAGFVNTDGITLGELVGKKVILVDFMTYSCINCQRTFPHVTAWYEKYKGQGLEIVGIHTPEFAFEKDIENVRAAMKKAGITYPVVLDNDYGTWRAWGNQYWPRKYLIDINGNVVYDHIGEGNYEETESKIQELLTERAQVLGQKIVLGDVSKTAEANSVLGGIGKSPETYFGSARNEFLGNGTRGRAGEQTLTLPKDSLKNTLYLGGSWNLTPEYAQASRGNTVRYRYNAQEVYVVAVSARPVQIEILQDGKLVAGSAGSDVVKGVITVQESKLYKVIKNTAVEEHVLEMRIKDSGVQLFAFTFG